MGHLNSFSIEQDGKHYLLKGSGYKNNDAAVDAWRKGENPELGIYDSENAATDASKKMSAESDHTEPFIRRELGPLSEECLRRLTRNADIIRQLTNTNKKLRSCIANETRHKKPF